LNHNIVAKVGNNETRDEGGESAALGGSISRTQRRVEHANLALMREAVRCVASDKVCDAILEAAVAKTTWPHWEDFGATFAFVGGAFSDAVRDALGSKAASTVAKHALDILLQRGRWDEDSLPPPGPSTLRPKARASAVVSDCVPMGSAAKAAIRHPTMPYLALGRACEDEPKPPRELTSAAPFEDD
jgi:hypothetical protein